MSYLLDTNVISELTRRNPDVRVRDWFQAVPDAALFMSVLTVGEIRKGIEALHDETRREALRLWLEEDLPGWFESRLLPINAAVADRWGKLMASAGRTLPAIDGLIAATALHHDLRIVTRNEADFRLPGLEVVNPWRP